MRSLSPLAIRVGWVNLDRSEGAERPNFWIAFSWVRNALVLIFLSRSMVRSSSRLTNAFAAGLPAALRLKNRNSFGIRPGQGRAEDVPVGHADDLVDVLAAARPGPGQHEPADQVGVLDDQVLGDHAAHREGEDVDLVVAERGDELVGVVGGLFDGVGNLSGRGADTTLVEGDDVPVLRDGVDDAGVPVVQGRGEVDEEDDGDAALRAKLPVGVGGAADGDGAGRSLGVGGDDGCVAAGAHDGSPCDVDVDAANLSTLNNEATQKRCQAPTRRRPSSTAWAAREFFARLGSTGNGGAPAAPRNVLAHRPSAAPLWRCWPVRDDQRTRPPVTRSTVVQTGLRPHHLLLNETQRGPGLARVSPTMVPCHDRAERRGVLSLPQRWLSSARSSSAPAVSARSTGP